MTPPKVSIIVLQHNNSQDTLRCLASLKELDYPNYSIIIVDNASSQHHFNNIRLFIENERKSGFSIPYTLYPVPFNSGYSGGNNTGIKSAIKSGADYVLVLNPDVIVEKNLLTKLVEAGESSPRIALLGPIIDEGSKKICGGQIKWFKPTLPHLVVQLLSGPPQLSSSTTKYVIGAAMLIKRSLIEEVGFFDERYFLYFEDADLNVRAKKHGFQLWIVADVIVKHRPQSSTSTLGSPMLLRYHYRNAHLFNWKNGPFWIKFALPFWSFFIIIKQLVKILLIPAKREISRAILAGVGDFYHGRFGRIDTF